MNKIAKAIAVTVLAGTMCAGVGAMSACGKTEGKSAYEIAVENGFTGTEQEWLDSLKVSTTVVSSSVSYSINDKGQRVATFTFTMSDGTTQTKTEILPASVANVELYRHNTVIWTEAEIQSKNYNLAGLNWRVTYDNGYTEYLPVTKDQIQEVIPEEETGNYYRDDFYRVKVNFNKYWSRYTTFDVLAVDNLDTFNTTYTAETEIEQDGYYCRVGETYGINNVYVANYYNEISVTQHYNEEDPYQSQTSAYRYQSVTAAMFDKAVDTSTTGIKFYSVTAGEGNSAVTGSVTVVVYDKSVSNLESLRVETQAINLTQNDNEKTIATEAAKLVGQTLYVSQYEIEDGSDYNRVKITADMIDYSEVNQKVPGIYYVKVNYRGSAAKVLVTVSPDMTGLEAEHTLNGMEISILSMMPEEMQKDPITRIDLYENGYAELFAGGDSLASEYGYFGYTLVNGTLTIDFFGDKFMLLTVNLTDADNKTFTAYDFSGLTASATYTGNFGAPATIKTYANGFATMDMEGMSLVCGYKLEQGILTFPIMDSYYEFVVGANNELTIIETR